MAVELKQMKQYLRIDLEIEDFDDEIEELIQQAQIYIDSCCGTKYYKYDDKVRLSELLLKKIVKDLNSNKGMKLDKKGGYDNIVSSIFDILANCGDLNE